MLISDRFPYVGAVISIGTWSLPEALYIDTGFEGGILIPSYLSAEILASPTWLRFRVAHDQVVRAPVWNGSVELAGQLFAVDVAAMGSRFLLGREVTDHLLMTLNRGVEVRIEL